MLPQWRFCSTQTTLIEQAAVHSEKLAVELLFTDLPAKTSYSVQCSACVCWYIVPRKNGMQQLHRQLFTVCAIRQQNMRSATV